jgi:thioredoxin-like negative regulator of GroEL
MAVKPIVDAVESQYQGRLEVIRLDIQTSVGRQIASVFDFQYTPTFIYFDAQGREQWRSVGSLDTRRLNQSLQ